MCYQDDITPQQWESACLSQPQVDSDPLPSHVPNSRFIPYQIADAAQETHCRMCGYPLYIEDSAILFDDHTFCTRTCARQYSEFTQKESE